MEDAFPSPLEVDRFLYLGTAKAFEQGITLFPAPLEVDRYLYLIIRRTKNPFEQFPAPLEVDRFLYK